MQYQQRQCTRNQSPEGRTYSEQRDAGSGHEKSNQRGLPIAFARQGRGQIDSESAKGRENPTIVISNAETRKAPVASAKDTPAAPVISIAAPGVDHAVTTGMR